MRLAAERDPAEMRTAAQWLAENQLNFRKTRADRRFRRSSCQALCGPAAPQRHTECTRTGSWSTCEAALVLLSEQPGLHGQQQAPGRADGEQEGRPWPEKRVSEHLHMLCASVIDRRMPADGICEATSALCKLRRKRLQARESADVAEPRHEVFCLFRESRCAPLPDARRLRH